jgi:hypothetical protein
MDMPGASDSHAEFLLMARQIVRPPSQAEHRCGACRLRLVRTAGPAGKPPELAAPNREPRIGIQAMPTNDPQAGDRRDDHGSKH